MPVVVGLVLRMRLSETPVPSSGLMESVALFSLGRVLGVSRAAPARGSTGLNAAEVST